MNYSTQWRIAALGCSLSVLLGTAPAYAYTDPGSGALLWQLAVAALFSGLFYVRRIVNKIREWVSGRKKTPAAATSSQDD